MDLEQFVADSTENTSIARYRALHRGWSRTTVPVKCGMCGAVQSERLRQGARWIEMECRRCGLCTRAELNREADSERETDIGARWLDGLDPRDRLDR